LNQADPDDLKQGDLTLDGPGALFRSPVAHLLLDGGHVAAANAAARALLATGDLEGRALDELLAACVDPVEAVAGDPWPDGRRLVALLPLGAPGVVDDPLAGLVGEAYLARLLERIAARTGACTALLGEIDATAVAPAVETLCVVEDGRRAENFRYELAGSPCSGVFDGELCLHAAGVAAAFPDDAALARRGVEGYAGVPLRDGNGRVPGALVLMFRGAIADPGATRRLLETVAPRAAAEIQRMRFQRRLAESEQRYRDLVETSEDGLVVFRGRRPVYANPAAARILGYAGPDALCAVDDISALVSAPDRATVDRQIVARIAGARVDSVFEIGVQHLDGQVVPVQVSASELHWQGRPALQVLVVDLSARKAREDRVRQAERMASLGKLTGGIAHDFNNLLAVILGNLELIAEAAEPGIEKAARQARIAAQRGADLTERLLTFARRQALRPRRVQAAQLLDETRGLLGPVLGEDIDLAIEAGSDDIIDVDPSQLQTALINLAINARDAMAGGGEVRIRAFAVDADAMGQRFPEADDNAFADHVCIEVSDTGPGMPPEIRAQAFEPFFTTKGSSKGTGLGLSMVHGFVTQSRGQIELDSVPDRGTSVRLYLPRSADAAPVPLSARSARPPVARDEAGPVGSGRRALVIEDEDSVREVAVAMLQGLGFDVDEAADGPSGRSALEGGRFDFLLSDVVLPAGQRGPDIAAEALGRDPAMSVLFMSGYAESSDFQKFRLEHDFRLIRKPFRFDQLRQEVEAVFGEATS
jgi:PAS domain S-box-containing protein